MSDVVYAVEVNGERAKFKSNPTNLFEDEKAAAKARDGSTDESVKAGEIVAYRLSKTIVI